MNIIQPLVRSHHFQHYSYAACTAYGVRDVCVRLPTRTITTSGAATDVAVSYGRAHTLPYNNNNCPPTEAYVLILCAARLCRESGLWIPAKQNLQKSWISGAYICNCWLFSFRLFGNSSSNGFRFVLLDPRRVCVCVCVDASPQSTNTQILQGTNVYAHREMVFVCADAYLTISIAFTRIEWPITKCADTGRSHCASSLATVLGVMSMCAWQHSCAKMLMRSTCRPIA